MKSNSENNSAEQRRLANLATPKQRLFVREYCRHLNATRAAIAAGYSEKGAAQAGARLLTNVKVSAEIAKLTQKACEKLEISAENVLKELVLLDKTFPDVGMDCPLFTVMVVLFSAALLGTVNVEALCAFTGYGPEYVWGIAENMTINRSPARGGTMSFEIASTAFAAGEMIPKKFTCDGSDVSPKLSWTEAPCGDRELCADHG